jgi:hypothetical protein
MAKVYAPVFAYLAVAYQLLSILPLAEIITGFIAVMLHFFRR